MNNLICHVKGHLCCFCSCSGDPRCCGCYGYRPHKQYYLHCLDCGKEFDTDEEGHYDTDLLIRDREELVRRRRKGR